MNRTDNAEVSDGNHAPNKQMIMHQIKNSSVEVVEKAQWT